jgi:hypothetical protein
MTIAEFFEYRPGWYRSAVVSALVLVYYGLLRSILKAKPGLRRGLTRCRRCGIFFLAHRCNAGRRDLGCPFGCQEAHRREESTKRSVAYYRDETGKMKKRIQNGRRGEPKPAPAETDGPGEPSEAMVKHLQRVLGAIEGRRVSREEVLALRQRSLGRWRAVMDNAVRCNERPP